MSPAARLRFASSLLAVPLLLALACQGNISGVQGQPPPDSSGLVGPGAGTTMSPTAMAPSDDTLRAKDPGLFDIALKYFPGQTSLAPKKRLFRLTRQQLDLTTQQLLPDSFKASTPALTALPRDPLQTNYEYADNLSFSEASFTPLSTWAQTLTDHAKAAPSSVIDCSKQDDSAACLDEQARAFVRRAFRDVVTDATLGSFSSFFAESAKAVGVAQATADLVSVVLTSPAYLFRQELNTDASGTLVPAELLQNVSYSLADAPPAALALSTPADLRPEQLPQVVDQVLTTAAARAKLLRFFLAWLEVKEPQDFDLSASVFPEFTAEVAAAVVQDTQRFLAAQLGGSAPALRDLTEGSAAFVSGPSAFLYGLTGASTGPQTLDPAQRLGIFTQPAVIASHSGPTTTRLVKRGVFFTRKVMCLPLGSPPPDVDTSIPSGLMGTERERIAGLTTPARCAGCHAFINPFGFMQESYDAMGRYRTTDDGKPVDASVSVDFLDEGKLSETTSVGALRGFTRSLRFQQCFTRQLFRFYSGREETEADDPTLRQLFFQFADQGTQDITGLLKNLALSPDFNRRVEAK